MAVAAVPRRSVLTIPLFLLAHFNYHVCTGMLVPLLPLIRDAFGLNYFQAGMLVSAFSLSQGLSQFPMGNLGDRLSLRKVLVVGLVGVGLATFAVGFTVSYYQLLALLIVLGILGGTYHPTASPLLSRFFDERQRGRVLGLHFMGGNAAFFFTPILAGFIAQFAGWRASYITLALPTVVIGLLFWRTIPEIGRVVHAGKSALAGPGLAGMIAILRPLGWLLAVAFTFQLISAAVQAFLPLFLVDRHGITPALAAMLVGLGWGAGTVSGPVGGMLSDRLGRRPVILTSLILTGPCIYLITVWGFGPLLILSLMAYGFANTLKAPVMESLIIDVMPAERRGTFMGLYFLINQELGGIATPIIGGFIDHYGLFPVFSSLALVATLASAVVLLARRRI